VIPFLFFGNVPVNAVAPVVSGVAYVGNTLTTTNGTWTDAASFTYQWQRNSIDIGGATASTYVVTLADEGEQLRCVVTATGPGGMASANSNVLELWVPTDLGLALAGWYDAEDAATITLGVGVSQWADRSGRGNDVVQAVGANQPTYSATGWETVRPGVTFNGVTHRMAKAVPAIGVSVAAIGIAMAIRVNALPAASTPAVVIGSGAGTAARYTLRYSAIGRSSSIRRLDVDASAADLYSAPLVAGVAEVANVQQHYATQTEAARINGVEEVFTPIGTLGVTDVTTPAALRIMTNILETVFVSGVMHEIVLFDGSDQTLLVREKIDGYLAWRAGITSVLPALNPYKNTPPPP
jgi:hypothetical protein